MGRNMSKVFVLMARSGQYSDQEHWPIAVYTEFESANRECEALSAKIDRYFKARNAIQDAVRTDISALGPNTAWNDPRREALVNRNWEERDKLSLEIFGGEDLSNVGDTFKVVEVELK